MANQRALPYIAVRISSLARQMRDMILRACDEFTLVWLRERYVADAVDMGDGVFGAARVVAVQLRSHIEECGRRYEAQRDEVRAVRSELGSGRTELTLEIAKLRTDQFLMDDRNRKAIQSIYTLLWCVAGGVLSMLAAVVGILMKAQLHIAG